MPPLVVIASLLGAAALLIVGAPFLLARGAWRVAYPRLALALWHAAFAIGVLCAVASLLWTTAFACLMGSAGCTGWLEPTVVVIAAWVGLAGFGAIVALVVSRTEPLAEADRALRLQLTHLTATNRCHDVRGVRVVVLESDVPVAFSVRGDDARVVVTTRLERELTPAQLRAVIEHERAHLVQHHGFISQLAQVNRACLPAVPAAREFERTTKFLVELIADDAAARVVGAAAVANALLRVGTMQGDESVLLRARRIAQRPPRGSVSTRRVPVEQAPVFS